ncbi:EpsG family protein [Sporosarcina psychrophila]|uniref:EpsG family protein n=1 Tax=Sporosarcina psychrophila TaxID=1476 RepID=UPI0030CC38BA
MGVYYGLILWIGIVALLSLAIRNIETKNKFIIILSSLGIILVQSLRSPSVGVDVIGYLIGYELIESIDVFSNDKLFNYEIGYMIYSLIFAKLNFSNQIYITVIVLSIIIPVAYTLYKNSKNLSISIFIYITLGFFAFSFSGLRQMIAIAIVFYSFKYIKERKIIKFLLFIFLGWTFHISAIIFIFAYPLYFIKLKLRHFIMIIPLFIIIYLLRSSIFLRIYQIYKGEEGEVVITNAYTMLLVMILIYLLSYVFGSVKNVNLNLNAYRNYLLISIFIQIFASQSNIAMRAGYYYYIFVTLLIPEVIKNQKDPKIRIISVYMLIAALLYFFSITVGSGQMNITPYNFFWNDN